MQYNASVKRSINLRITFFGTSLLLMASLVSAKDTRYRAYVGTYTDTDSQGIYAFTFDPATGETGTVELSAETPSPSFLVANSAASYLYAANELDILDGNMTGGVSVFAINGTSGKLKELQRASSAGAGPAHLSLDKTGRYLLVANYDGGNFAVFPVGTDGKLGARTAFIQNAGSSVNKDRQKSPHAHEILGSPDGQWVLVADLGTDQLLVYRFDSSDGTLTPNKPAYYKVKPGSGPRHFAFAPSGKYVYLTNEMASTVDVLAFDPEAGKLKHEQTVSTLSAESKGENTTAEIAVDAAGKTLYVSNRGDDSIAVFSIAANTGKLTFSQRVATGGKEPRHFTLDPTGKWLFAENQNSGTINLFAVDASNGNLTATTHTVKVTSPVCVVLVPIP
jgi:6-phosphogluconolactonase